MEKQSFIGFRAPTTLKKYLETSAKKAKRTLSKEIILRLEKTIRSKRNKDANVSS